MHSSLLRLAPYYALWYPGPLAKEFRAKEMRPRYKHDAAKLSLRTRGIDLSLSDVMMSDICKSADLHFVGISIYSPRYKAKAERLLRSCARVGICCKVRQPRSQTVTARHCNNNNSTLQQQQFDTAILRNCNRTHLSPPHPPHTCCTGHGASGHRLRPRRARGLGGVPLRDHRLQAELHP